MNHWSTKQFRKSQDQRDADEITNNRGPVLVTLSEDGTNMTIAIKKSVIECKKPDSMGLKCFSAIRDLLCNKLNK